MWTEARLKLGTRLGDFYAWLGPPIEQGAHHFWDEPWWPGGWVVRIPGDIDTSDCPHVDHAIEWDATEDERLYREAWPTVQQLFSTYSQTALQAEDLSPNELGWHLSKLMHCFLNAHGLSYEEEAECWEWLAKRTREIGSTGMGRAQSHPDRTVSQP